MDYYAHVPPKDLEHLKKKKYHKIKIKGLQNTIIVRKDYGSGIYTTSYFLRQTFPNINLLCSQLLMTNKITLDNNRRVFLVFCNFIEELKELLPLLHKFEIIEEIEGKTKLMTPDMSAFLLFINGKKRLVSHFIHQFDEAITIENFTMLTQYDAEILRKLYKKIGLSYDGHFMRKLAISFLDTSHGKYDYDKIMKSLGNGGILTRDLCSFLNTELRGIPDSVPRTYVYECLKNVLFEHESLKIKDYESTKELVACVHLIDALLGDKIRNEKK
jgi:hypothetical protein